MSIMTILAAVVVPRYALACARYRADLCVDRVAADVRRVQAEARSDGSSRSIHYDVSANEYVMTDVKALDGGASSSTVHLNDAPYHATLVSAVFGADDTLQIDGWGLPVSGGTVVIAVGSEVRSINVNGQTGEVTFE